MDFLSRVMKTWAGLSLEVEKPAETAKWMKKSSEACLIEAILLGFSTFPSNFEGKRDDFSTEY